MINALVMSLVVFAIALLPKQAVATAPSGTQERLVEWTIESAKRYADPFNDVEVDVIFSKAGQTWRVPTFWRGDQRWTVRFAPPEPGEYAYRLQSTDPSNPDLNGHEGHVSIGAYRGANELLRHGMLRVSANKRYFEYADGSPFYWLGDTWWMGLSERLSWENFQRLTADRKAKGFTLVQMVAGLVPFEEQPPADPGFCNEGGPVWEGKFERINPKYFDYADRRIQHLLEAGMVPAMVGAWNRVLGEMGVAKMKQHWRYLIARYGAYPVFWILGGEVKDPPEDVLRQFPPAKRSLLMPTLMPGWTEVARYVREHDPYHHPLTVHESTPPVDAALQDDSLTDFDLVQSGHYGWASMAVSVAQLNLHYSHTGVIKPIVQGEIGYEKLGETHFEDFQRTAFWLSMLNGAAGHTYGANGTWEAYSADQPLHRLRWSFMSWEEGMRLPGSYQVGLAAKLLRQYPWWRFTPHPEWVAPRGTTLLEPHAQIHGSDFGWPIPCDPCELADRVTQLEADYPGAEWKARHGTFRLPYAAGIPGEVRFVYVPPVGLVAPTPPTILGLESGVRYRAFWWEPSSGTRIELGSVARPDPGEALFDSALPTQPAAVWRDYKNLRVLDAVHEVDAVASVQAMSKAKAGLLIGFQDVDHYIAAVYSPQEKALYLLDRRKGVDGPPLGKTAIEQIGAEITLNVEIRNGKGAASITDGAHTYRTPIVDLTNKTPGTAGLLYWGKGGTQSYRHFQLRRSPVLADDGPLPVKLYDAEGVYRGDLVGADMVIGSQTIPSWDSLRREKHILLDAYRPERMPASGDWLLVLTRVPETK